MTPWPIFPVAPMGIDRGAISLLLSQRSLPVWRNCVSPIFGADSLLLARMLRVFVAPVCLLRHRLMCDGCERGGPC